MEDHPFLYNWHVALQRVGWAVLTPDWWRFHIRGACWRLYLHDRDGAVLESDGIRQSLRAGHMYVIPADTQLAGFTEKEVGQLFCHFHLVGLPLFSQQVLFDPLIELPVTTIPADLTATLIAQLQSGLTAGLALECRLKALIFSALGWALDAVPPERLAHSRLLDASLQPVVAAIEYIDQHYDESVSLEVLADLCAFSPVYFGRRFHQCTGMTPIHYLQEVRVKAAMQHLAFTDDSIESIARSTGFGSRAYFTRIFSRHNQQSPGEYRKAFRT